MADGPGLCKRARPAAESAEFRRLQAALVDVALGAGGGQFLGELALEVVALPGGLGGLRVAAEDALEAGLKLEAGSQPPWRAAAVGVYQKWVSYLIARKSERRIANVPLRRTWRDWPASLRGSAGNSPR